MATRSAIGVYHGTKIKAVYCHWDGYLEHNGRILQKHYDSAKANHLVAMGNISSLGTNIGEKHPFSKFEINKESPDFNKLIALNEYADEQGWTTFYGRDREETDTEFKSFDSGEEFLEYFESCGCEYFYLMKDGQWFVSSLKQPLFQYLDEALTKTEEPV